jgi:hypothetical protein
LTNADFCGGLERKPYWILPEELTPQTTRRSGDSMIAYFQEHNGDYLAIDTSTNRYYLDVLGKDHFEGRATAIAVQIGSVCTTGISREFLRRSCKRVAMSKVPGDWLKAIGL